MKESDIQRTITEYLDAERIFYRRMNAGDKFGVYKGKRWRIKGQPAGTADLLAIPWLKYLGQYKAPLPLWIEVKTPDGKTKPETARAQEEFRNYVRGQGHYYIKVTDVSEVIQFMKEHK